MASQPFIGPSSLSRFDRDALDKPGVRWVILLQGSNDISASDMLDHAAGSRVRAPDHRRHADADCTGARAGDQDLGRHAAASRRRAETVRDDRRRPQPRARGERLDPHQPARSMPSSTSSVSCATPTGPTASFRHSTAATICTRTTLATRDGRGSRPAPVQVTADHYWSFTRGSPLGRMERVERPLSPRSPE